MFGYKMELMTDTEVIAYLFDPGRRHKLPVGSDSRTGPF
jgi:hypothetical protein